MSTAAHITQTALAVFHQQGFHASGVDFLSECACVTKRTLYRHFPTKDALIAAALELRHQQFMAELDAHLQNAPVADRPLAYIDFVAQKAAQPVFYGCAFINAAAEFSCSEDGPHQQAKAHKQALETYLLGLCEAAQMPSPQALAMQLYLLGEGLIVASQVQGFNAKWAQAARDLIALSARTGTSSPEVQP